MSIVKTKRSLPYELIKYSPFKPPEIPERTSWSASSLRLFRKCKRKWYWRYILRLRPKWTDSNLAIGTAFHAALGEWYRNPKATPKKFRKKIDLEANRLLQVIQASSDYYDQEELDKASSAAQTFIGMITGYADVYSRDLKRWIIKPEDVERRFIVAFDKFDFIGVVDLLPTDKKTGKRIIVEHKSASSIGDSYVDRLPLDTQIRSYIFGAREGLGLKPTEVVYDVVRKCKLRKKSGESIEAFNERIALDYASRPDFYFFRESLKFSTKDIDAFVRDLHHSFEEFRWMLKRWNPLDPASWPCSDHICNEYFKTCPYMTLCTSGLDRGTSKLYTQSDEPPSAEEWVE